MEQLPPLPFESAKNPDESGSNEISKKRKKKTTKVPLPVKPEKAEEKQESNKEEFLGELFVNHEDKSKKTDKEAEVDEPVESEADSETDSESEPDSPATPEAVDTTETPEVSIEPLAGVEETEEEAKKEEPAPAVPPPLVFENFDIPARETEMPASEAAEPSKMTGFEQPEVTVPSSEALVETEEVIPMPRTYEAIPNEPPAPDMHRMIDPNVRVGVEAAATRYQAEKVEPITSQELNQETIRAEKRGLSRGVVSGALAGWWLGRRGKREAMQEAAIIIKGKNEDIKDLKANQAVAEDRLSSVERTAVALREFISKRSKQQPEATPVAPAEAFWETEPKPETRVEAIKPTKAEKVMEQAPNKSEPLPEEQPVTPEMFTVPKGRRVETSVWHRIEVDAKTGRTVEKPSVEYGKEFKREQKQEKLASEAAKPHIAVQVGTALLRATKSATTKAQKLSEGMKKQNFQGLADTKYVRSQLASYTTSPLIWVAGLVVVILLFLTGIIS